MEEIRSRRSLLKAAGLMLPLGLLPLPGFARVRDMRRLRFDHTHTGERLDVVYAERGRYLSDALAEINYFLRDFRTGDVHAIDPDLLDILHTVQTYTDSQGRFEVLSGYRSSATNELLRQTSNGVAEHSLHLTGQAIDIRLAGVPTRTLRRAAISVGHGGVGYYPESDFVHIDTGRVRTW